MIKVHLQCANTTQHQRASYVFETLFSTLGLPWQLAEPPSVRMAKSEATAYDWTPLTIYYGHALPDELQASITAGEGVIHIVRAVERTQVALKPELAEWTVEKTSSGFLAVLNFDLVAATLRCLSGIEGEMGMLGEDMPSNDNHNGGEAGNPTQIPWVNQYLQLLLDVICLGFTRLGLPLIQKWYWPGGKLFAANLSHDVDRIRRNREFFLLASTALHSLRLLSRRQFRQAANKLRRIIHLLTAEEDPQTNFQSWLNLEEAHGFRSAFYFLGGPRWWRRYGARYDLRGNETRQIISAIADRGWEVGLHGSYYAYEAEGGLQREKQELETVLGVTVSGHRQHYLHLRLPDSWRVQEAAGLVYDTTYGYRFKAGFKAGICFPFFPYDVETERRLGLLELPLIFMDSNHSNMLSEQGRELAWLLLERVRQYHGLITFNFHSCSVDGQSFPGWFELYGQLLDHLQEQNAFVAPGSVIAEWWKQRDCLRFITARQTAQGTIWAIKADQRICDVYLKVYNSSARPIIKVTGSVDYQLVTQGQTWWIKIGELGPDEIIEVEVIATLEKVDSNAKAETVG